MDSLLQDLKHSLRALRRNPGFATAAILTLALGLGANTAIFSVVNALLLRPLPFHQPDRLVSVWGRHPSIGLEAASLPDFLDWRAGAPGFTSLAAIARGNYPVTGEGEPELVPGALVTADFFRTIGVTMAAGRGFQPGEDRGSGARVAVISYGYWQRHYGGRPDAIGRQLSSGSESPYTIVGVAPRGFRLENEADLWAPLPIDSEHGRREDFLQVVGRLRPEVTVAGARAQLVGVMRRLAEKYPDSNARWSADVVPIREWLVGEVRPTLLLFMGAVGLVLLIACANVANLMLARLVSRQREITVRSALGASRNRLIRHILTESVLLAMVGGGLGLLLAVWGVQALRVAGGAAIPRSGDITLNFPALAFAFALSVITGLVFGTVPALRLMGRDLHEGLSSGSRGVAGVARGRALRGGLVAAEVATAFVLLVGAGLLLRSFSRLLEVDPGFRVAGVLTARVSLPKVKYASEPRRTQLYDALVERVTAMPGVQAAGMASGAPLGEGPPQLAFAIEGAPAPAPGVVQDADVVVASPGYFRALEIPLVRGRLIGPADIASAPGAAVVGEQMAHRYWNGRDPIGSRITIDDPADTAAVWFTVVGVVRDVHHLSLAEVPRPQLYLPMAQSPPRGMVLTARVTGDPGQIVGAVRGALAELDAGVPLSNVRTMPDRMADSVARPRLSAWLLGIFAATALLLAAVGIYGVIAYGVVQRTRELGIRLALGAGRTSMLRMVLTQGMRPVLVGMGIGAVLALAGSGLLRRLLFGVTAIDPLTYAVVVFFLLGVALVACLGPARRAARSDPMTALRAD